MKKYYDLSTNPSCAYQMAELISSPHYNNILYLEFHVPLDGNYTFQSERLEGFRERSQKFYPPFVRVGFVDDFEATINVAIKVASDWFVLLDCGSNFYAGYGPGGILKLREACFNRNISMFLMEGKIEDWLVAHFPTSEKLDDEGKYIDRVQFEKAITVIENFSRNMQRTPYDYQGLEEPDLRTKLLTPLNTIFQTRGAAEAISGKGKTDILIRTEDGRNEHIFEFKVWKGEKGFMESLCQLDGYVVSHNNYAGLVFFCYNQNFSGILQTCREYFANEGVPVSISNEHVIRISKPNPKNGTKKIEVHIIFVNLFC